MKWADRAKKILESPRTQTDITDISGMNMTSVGSVGATCKAFLENDVDIGAERSRFDSNELLHPRDCLQWWKGCLSGCPWYHPGGGDFCWKVNRAWWESPYQGGEP